MSPADAVATPVRRPTMARGSLADPRGWRRPVAVEIRQPGRPPQREVVEEALVVGRATQGLQLVDPSVSRQHVILRVAPAGLTVEDLGSRYGTTVNGNRITGEVAVALGDQVRIGNTTIARVDLRDAGPAAVAPAGGEVPGGHPAWQVQIVPPTGDPREVLVDHPVTVGRSDADIMVGDRTVSSRHLRLHPRADGVGGERGDGRDAARNRVRSSDDRA
jgi:pSer/pThr/pTyr-binding forkhead associated (FHA) protein